MKILIEAGMGGLVHELMDHVSDVVLETARCLQRWTEPQGVGHDSNPCDEFAEQLMRCTIDLPVPKVRSSCGSSM